MKENNDIVKDSGNENPFTGVDNKSIMDAIEKTLQDTYTVRLECSNCHHRQTKHIQKGVTIRESSVTCSNCGCSSFFALHF